MQLLQTFHICILMGICFLLDKCLEKFPGGISGGIRLPMQETQFPSLGQGDSLEEDGAGSE